MMFAAAAGAELPLETFSDGLDMGADGFGILLVDTARTDRVRRAFASLQNVQKAEIALARSAAVLMA